mgnify:FL=1
MSYMENIGKVLQAYSKKAFEYGDAKAWDNRKGKAWKRCTPTGKVYRRLMRQEWQAATLPLFEAVKNLEALQVTA